LQLTQIWAIAFFHMQIKNSQPYLLGLSQNQMPQGSVNKD